MYLKMHNLINTVICICILIPLSSKVFIDYIINYMLINYNNE